MEEDSPQAVMLGLTSRATPIRRIRIQRGPGSLFTHTSNNAEGRRRFQKKSFSRSSKCLKFSNVFSVPVISREAIPAFHAIKIRGATKRPKKEKDFLF